MKSFHVSVLENNMYIDSHCHINDPLYKENADVYVKEAIFNNVQILLCIGYDLDSSKIAVEIASKHPEVYSAVGISPQEVKNAKERDLEEIEKLLSNEKVICVGEIGLDYYYEKDVETRNIQYDYFLKQIALANKYHKFISVHCRDAYEDCFTVLKNHKVLKKGIIHCYSGSLEMAREFIKLGYFLGIGGVCTFKNAIKIKDVVKNVSLENIVLETDAPYLTPVPHRGEPNHSKYIPLIALEVGTLKNKSIEEVEEVTSQNFLNLLNK